MAKAATAVAAPSGEGFSADTRAATAVAVPPGESEDWSRFAEDADIAEEPKEEAPAESAPEPEAQEESTETTEPVVDDQPADDEADTPDETDSEPEAAEPEFDDALLADAQRLGYEVDEAKSFGTPESLRKALIAEDRRLIRLSESRQRQAAAQPPSGTTTQKPDVAQQAAAQVVDALADIGLRPEDVGQEVVDAFRKLEQRSERRVLEIQSRYDGYLQQVDMMLTAQQLDSAISTLDDEYKATYGDGPTLELDPESKEVQSRVLLNKQARALMQTYAEMGKPIGFRTAVRKAAIAANPEKAEQTARAKIVKQVEKRQKVQTTPPTSRKSAPPPKLTQEERLAKIASEYSKKTGLPVGESDSLDD